MTNLFEKMATTINGRRYITKDKLFEIIKMIDPSASEVHLARMWLLVDRDGNGDVDLEEFQAAILGTKKVFGVFNPPPAPQPTQISKKGSSRTNKVLCSDDAFF